MAKNCMAAVAKLLGVEIGEEFIIENKDRKETVVLAADGFHVIQPNNVVGPDHGKLLSKVLQGLFDVVKKPFEPEVGDTYFYPCPYLKQPLSETWSNHTMGFALKTLGMVYRTMEEAKANFAKDYQKLTGKKLEE